MDIKGFIRQAQTRIICDMTSFTHQEAPSIDCLIVLNNQINPTELSMLIKTSRNVVLADGGCNHLYSSDFKDSSKIRTIIGDLDSAEKSILQYYENKGVKIEKVFNQDLNDFHKAVDYAINKGWNQIVCLGAFGDRMDQTLCSMSVTTHIMRNNKDVQILLFGRNNLMYLLRPNQIHEIIIGEWADKTGCGLIPFGKVGSIETKGFKWNLGKNQPFNSLEWGEFISTSNEILGNNVEIEATDEVFFICHFLK